MSPRVEVWYARVPHTTDNDAASSVPQARSQCRDQHHTQAPTGATGKFAECLMFTRGEIRLITSTDSVDQTGTAKHPERVMVSGEPAPPYFLRPARTARIASCKAATATIPAKSHAATAGDTRWAAHAPTKVVHVSHAPISKPCRNTTR